MMRDHGAAPLLLLHSGWAVTNIGDIGHTPGTLRYVEEHFPEVRITCWLHKCSSEVVSMLSNRFPDVTFVRGGSLGDDGTASTPELQLAFDNADMFIYNSGMHYNRYWAPPVNILQACIARQKPYGLYGQSFDGFYPGEAPRLKRLLSEAAFIYCRDNESLTFLRSEGVCAPIMEFGPDGCFGIDVRDDARATHFMRTHGLKNRRFLTVTLRTDAEICRNYPEDVPTTPGNPDVWCRQLRDVIVDWVTTTGLPVVLTPEVEKEILPAKTRLLDPLPESIRTSVVWRDSFWNADEAASLLSRARAVISMEPHTCIIALANGTPAIHYFTKHHGWKAYMFRDLGLPEWLVDIDTEPARRVSLALDSIHSDYDRALEKVHRTMSHVNNMSAGMIREVRRIMSTIPNTSIAEDGSSASSRQ